MPSLPSVRTATLAILVFVVMLNSGTVAISALTLPASMLHMKEDTNSTTTSTRSTQVTETPNITFLILGLVAIPATIATVLLVYKFARTPFQVPLAKILKRRAPAHLKPLRVLNGAICPMCFRPMMYEPKGEDWHCEHCGVYYEA